MYKRARSGELKQFTGVDSPYEAPLEPELRLDTVAIDASTLADSVLARLGAEGITPHCDK